MNVFLRPNLPNAPKQKKSKCLGGKTVVVCCRLARHLQAPIFSNETSVRLMMITMIKKWPSTDLETIDRVIMSWDILGVDRGYIGSSITDHPYQTSKDARNLQGIVVGDLMLGGLGLGRANLAFVDGSQVDTDDKWT